MERHRQRNRSVVVVTFAAVASDARARATPRKLSISLPGQDVALMASLDLEPSPGTNGAGNRPPELFVEAGSSRSTLVLGVDIGAHGAAALLDEGGDLLAVEDLPVLDSGPAGRPEISPHLFAAIVRRWSPARAWVEHIGPRLGDRPAGAFAFGGSKVTVEAVLATLGVPFRSITPATWKRAASIPPGRDMKDLARARAIERWPNYADLFARKLDHDRAEAASIGWVSLQRERAGR